MENRDIAAVFEQIASLMKILQDDPKWTFKAAAYERAARSLESFPERAADLARDAMAPVDDRSKNIKSQCLGYGVLIPKP